VAGSNLNRLSHLIWLLTFILAAFGLLTIGSASTATALADFQDPWHYVKLQAIWVALGVISFVLVRKLPMSFFKKNSRWIYLGGLIALALVFIPGLGLKIAGARRWLGLGWFSFQPAEFAKLTLVIYLSRFFTDVNFKIPAFLWAVGLYCLLVISEPDLGTTLVLSGIGLLMFYVCSGRTKQLLLLAPLGLILSLLLIVISPYRLSRLKTYLNSSHDPQGSSYQIRQALIGLGSGGWLGTGLGQSRQKYEFLPAVTTDSIFVIVGEEFGFVGSVIVVSAFLFLVLIGLEISKVAPDKFTSHLAVGITGWIGLQTFLNLSAVTALVPLTGVPLPFISYGGSSVISLFIASGILANIAKGNTC